MDFAHHFSYPKEHCILCFVGRPLRVDDCLAPWVVFTRNGGPPVISTLRPSPSTGDQTQVTENKK
jgi:hypothetical protein